MDLEKGLVAGGDRDKDRILIRADVKPTPSQVLTSTLLWWAFSGPGALTTTLVSGAALSVIQACAVPERSMRQPA
jgi:hypothetical protein